MSDVHREALKKRIGIPALPPMAGKSKGPVRRKRDYTPLSWEKFFDRKDDIQINDTDTFRVYRSGDKGPLLVLLHGGGHSALSWAVFTKAVIQLCECQVLAVDLRGHGETHTNNDKDLSADTLSKDIGDLVHTMYGDRTPPILLIGHSMGGATAVHIGVQCLLSSLAGLAVIDVVEGTTLDALSSMQSFLKGRPKSFKSLEQGIEWCVRSGQIHNVESARVSMAGQLVRCDSAPKTVNRTALPEINAIQEEEECEDIQTSPQSQLPTNSQDMPSSQENSESWKWRIDLSETEQFWEGWFVNMSKLFLSCPVPKLLLIAGVDRLDRELTIGQMQGKFEMQVLPHCGHYVHEDAPEKVAELIVTFLLRYNQTVAKTFFQRHLPAC